MKAIIKNGNEEEVIDNIIILLHGTSYGVRGKYEFISLWNNSQYPCKEVKLDGKTSVTLM